MKRIQKEMSKMILFSILAIALFVILAIAVVVIGIGGGLAITIFSDLIVCIVLIVLCIKIVSRFRDR